MGAPTAAFNAYRFYEDDNTDVDSLTAAQTQDNDISRQTGTANKLVLRIRLQQNNDRAWAGNAQLQAQKNGTGGYSDVTASAGPAGIRVTEAQYPDQEETAPDTTQTALLTGGTGTREDGDIDDSDGNVTSVALGKNNFEELAFCVYLVDADVNNGDYFDIQFNSTGANAITNTSTARITVIKGATVALSATGAAISGANGRLDAKRRSPATGVSNSAGKARLDVTRALAATGAAISIGVASATIAPTIVLSLSDYIASSGEDTTDQLIPPSGKSSGDFAAGRIQDDENPADSVDMAADEYTEMEWCWKGTDAAVSGGVYEFRVTINGTPIDTYTLTPTVTFGITEVLSATGAAISTGQARLDVTRDVRAIGAAVSIDKAGLGVTRDVRAVGAAVSTGKARLDVIRGIGTTSVAVSAAKAGITNTRPISATGVAVSTGKAGITNTRPFNATSVAISAAKAGITNTRPFSATSAAVSSGVGGIGVDRYLAAIGTSSSTGKALLTVSATVACSAKGHGQSAASAQLAVTRGVLATGAGISAASATIRGPSYLSLPGEYDDHADTPDATALDITGDMEVWVYACPDDVTPASVECMISKILYGNDKSWRFTLFTDGKLRWIWSEDGVNFLNQFSTVVPVWDSGTPIWIRMRFDVNNGASGYDVEFYTSTDRYDVDSPSWTKLGGTQTDTPATSIFSGDAEVKFGNTEAVSSSQQPFAGKMWRAKIFDGIDGARTLVCDAKFYAELPGTTSFTESSPQAATVTVDQSGDPIAEIVADLRAGISAVGAGISSGKAAITFGAVAACEATDVAISTGKAGIGADRALAAIGAAISSGKARLDVTRDVRASGSAISSAKSRADANRGLSSAGAAISSGKTEIGVTRDLRTKGVALSTSVADTLVEGTIPLNATGVALSTSKAGISADRALATSGAGLSTGRARLDVTRAIAATGASLSAGTANATIGATVALASTGVGLSTGKATTAATRAIIAVGAAHSTGKARLSVTRGISAAGVGMSTAKVAIGATRDIAAVSVGISTGKATLSVGATVALSAKGVALSTSKAEFSVEKLAYKIENVTIRPTHSATGRLRPLYNGVVWIDRGD